jgi:hypothetical protein
MNGSLTRLTLIIVTLLQIAAVVSAGTLDDYYLQQFGEVKSQQLQKAVLSISADVQEPARCGMPLKHSLRRDWKLLELPTQKVLAKQLASPVLAGMATFTSSAGHFAVHYATSGADAPPPTDVSGVVGVPDWVETVAATFENVYASYQSRGYRPAPTTTGGPYDIYLSDLASQGYYGVTTSNSPASATGYANSYTSWMELDNNFTDSIYKPTTYSPLQSLQITAAHEYHHAIQYGYTFYFDVWYAEATSTWMEDELYDSVNQLYSYIPAWFQYSTQPLNRTVGTDAVSSGAGYGRWIFNRFLAEKHTPAMVRAAWESAGTTASTGGNDIEMIPVLENLLATSYSTTLGSDFFEFTKRVYTRDWTSHGSEISKIHPYTALFTYAVPPASSSAASQTVIPALTLPRYSFAYYKFTPATGTTSLTLSINKSSGIQTALFKNLIGTISEITASGNGASYNVSDFGLTDEVALLVTNVSSTDGLTTNISTNGTLVLTSATEQLSLTTTLPPSSTSGSANGCFIATAAYGSYLHPQVQHLRAFRDEYLLTNVPGRAFVALYYRISPPLADFIARHPVLRGITRLLLTPVVVAVVHPLAAGFGLLLATALLNRPVRRRFIARVAI